jgi:RND family efflux transporter MFP subunit
MAVWSATGKARSGRGRGLLVALIGAVILSQGGAFAQPRMDSGKPRVGSRLDPSIINEFAGFKAVTRPSRDAVMGFSISTQVSAVLVRGGQEVTKGTLLVKGDDAEDVVVLELQELRAKTDLPVQRAKASMDLAKLEHERLLELRTKDASSTQEVERARLTFDTAKIDFEYEKVKQTQEVMQVGRLQARVDKLHLTAPFDGTVDNVLVDVGQAVTEQEKVIRVVNVDILHMDVPAPTDDVVTLGMKNGDKAWVLLDVATSPRVMEGKVVEVSPTTDLASRTRRIRVEIENPKGSQRVLAGEPAWVRFTQPPAGVISQVNTAAAVAPVASGK